MPRQKTDEVAFRSAVAQQLTAGTAVNPQQISTQLGIVKERADYLWAQILRGVAPAPAPRPVCLRPGRKGVSSFGTAAGAPSPAASAATRSPVAARSPIAPAAAAPAAIDPPAPSIASGASPATDQPAAAVAQAATAQPAAKTNP